MHFWPLTMAMTCAVGGRHRERRSRSTDINMNKVCTLKKLRKCTSWMSKLLLPDPRTGDLGTDIQYASAPASPSESGVHV
eukprot:2462131-Pleurochrysis_carterae.AAC.1